MSSYTDQSRKNCHGFADIEQHIRITMAKVLNKFPILLVGIWMVILIPPTFGQGQISGQEIDQSSPPNDQASPSNASSPGQDALSGHKLSIAEILDLLSGATLYGKYVDGRPDWKEHSSVTGQLFDVQREWLEVGQWNAYEDFVCYSYAVPSDGMGPGLSCFDVYEYKGDFYFYSMGSDYLVGYTYRVDRPGLM